MLKKNQLNFGKNIGEISYFHINTLPFLSTFLKDLLNQIREKYEDFNVIKLNSKTQKLSLLWYEDFNTTAFPCLLKSYSIDIETKEVRSSRRYISNNPPILHRKELLLAPDHSDIPRFASLTTQLEEAGLFYESHKIGFKKQWEKRLTEAGYEVIDHQLIQINSVKNTQINNTTIVKRHRTALTRHALSKPMQLLQKHGFLSGKHSLFDYGCGKGSDIEILQQNAIQAKGWDPYFFPKQPLYSADIVNLGFVLNVIEDSNEREKTLINAYSLCTRLISVAVMLGRQSTNRGCFYQDGVLTSRNTFQKYFSQSECRNYLRNTLNEEPIAVGAGIFFIFKDKEAEQTFIFKRYRRKRDTNQFVSKISKITQAKQQKHFYGKHQILLDTLWSSCITLGRFPQREEFPDANKIIDLFSTWRRGLNFIHRFHGEEELQFAFNNRRDDLIVYLAMRLFEQNRSYQRLATALQHDIKVFFGSYKNAQEAGKKLLFSTANKTSIQSACQSVANNGVGYFDKAACLSLHISLLSSLPPLLRVYIACGTQLYGDTSSIDLIKIHTQSGKLSLMIFDDFQNQALPRMVERIKIRLFDQQINFYQYGDIFTPPYLYLKSRFISDDYPNYKEQQNFDQTLQSMDCLDFSEHGMSPEIFDSVIDLLGMEIKGFDLVPSQRIPALDECCGKYHCFRDFIECGDTQAKIQLTNRPKQPESYYSLRRLALNIIDPVMDYFGGIELSYGFCSRKLATHIPTKIDPSQDQHASHELNTRGNLICKRLGAACDFIILDESMLEVAQWIVKNTPFDRLYYYGDDKPIHVSIGNENSRAIAIMRTSKKGYLYPVMRTVEQFLGISKT